MEQQVVHVLIRGRVQGVGFRAWTRHQAELRDLSGWVRNRRDGSVEAVFAGPRDRIDAMLRACRHGPAGSHVDEVIIGAGDDATVSRPQAGAFEVRATI